MLDELTKEEIMIKRLEEINREMKMNNQLLLKIYQETEQIRKRIK